MIRLDETHDPTRESWVASANGGSTDFPIQNLPYGVFSSGDGERRVGVAIGDSILDLTAAEEADLVRPSGERRVLRHSLNAFMSLPPAVWAETRARIADLLDARRTPPSALRLVPREEASLHLPFEVAGFTDFYASREHATNVGAMFRGREKALMPNWLHLPVGYNGRASTVVVSGTPVRRPNGQILDPGAERPRFGPSGKLDFELELGAVVGGASEMGRRASTGEAWEMIFGFVLLNDWSARDIQAWEYQPLGPFQSKAFATTISPWIVSRAALEPFRVEAPAREVPLLPYLQEDAPHSLDVALEVGLAPQGSAETVIARANASGLYYSAAQQLAHHTSSGCAMRTGDLLGSGTISGREAGTQGSLLELTANGREPLRVGDATRGFLEDGDTVTLRGRCEGHYRLGFGSCSGTVLPAVR